ncbi:MAG: LysR family transcriptional regulator [Pseudonocardiaceae bacterium]|nr:LysR family transcriptional regulator [Pseudonocardiaceae bacterium]
MLDIHRMRLLHEFATRGTIAATANALGYSPSAVSQQLSTLEREAGTSLLDRTARSAELTEAGRRLAEHAGRILADVELAEAELASHTGQPSGPVSITAFPTAAVALAPSVTRRLRRYPDLSLVLRQAAAAESLAQLRSGDIDIALVDDWTGELAGGHARLHVHWLCHDPLVLAVPADHRLAGDAPVRLRDLGTDSWIAAPPTEPSRLAMDRLLTAAGAKPAQPWEFQGLDTAMALVAQGLGIALVPRMATSSKAATVALRALPGRPPARDIYAISRQASASRPAVAAALDALRMAAREQEARVTPLG